jgi:hypothetical protein
MAVVKQPRADDGVGRRDQHDGLAALPSIKNFHACTDAGPDEVDQDNVAVINVGLVFFNYFDDAFLLAAAKVPERDRVTRVTPQLPLGILTPIFTLLISAAEHRAAQVNSSAFVQNPHPIFRACSEPLPVSIAWKPNLRIQHTVNEVFLALFPWKALKKLRLRCIQYPPASIF